MSDNLRARILNALINNTPPKYLAMPEDLSNLVTALIRDLPELQPRYALDQWEEGYDEGYSAGGGGC